MSALVYTASARGPRRSRAAVLVPIVLLTFVGALLVGCADASLTGAPRGGGRLQGTLEATQTADATGTVEPAPAAAPDPEPVEPAPAADAPKVTQGVVSRVVDGDTAVITVAGVSEKVRFIGINTPESTTRHEPFGEEASAYTKKALSGRTVFVETDVELRDKYGRLLAYIWLEKPLSPSNAEVRAKMFNAKLLLDGYAEQATYPPNVRYVELFSAYANRARKAGVGLWGLAVEEDAGSGSSAGESGGSGGSATGYIGNRNTFKFHYPACSSVGDMNPANKVPLSTRAQAIAGGYVPCQRCNP